MVSPIQPAPVEVENTTKESAGFPSCGFSDVFANAVSKSGGVADAKNRVVARRGKKTESNDGAAEKEQEAGKSSPKAIPAPVALPVQIAPSESTVPRPVHAMAAPAPDATARVAENGAAFNGVVPMWQREELAATAGAIGRVGQGEGIGPEAQVTSEEMQGAKKQKTENSSVCAEDEVKGFVESVVKETDSTSGEGPWVEAKGLTGDKLKDGTVAMDLQQFDATLTEPAHTGSREKSNQENSTSARLETDARVTADRPAQIHESLSVRTTGNVTANETDLQKAVAEVQAIGSGEQRSGNAHKIESADIGPVRNRKAPAGQAVENAGDLRVKAEGGQDGGPMPPSAHQEPAAEFLLETQQADHGKTIRANSTEDDSAGAHKSPNFEGAPGLITGAVTGPLKDHESKAGHQTFEPSEGVTLRSAEAWTRLSESFVPGASQLLLRLSHQEMRFGWNTPEFGHVEVRAMVDHDRVGAVVSADARLCDSLQADLGNLSRALSHQSLELAHFQTSSSGSDGSATRGQDSDAQSERAASGEGANWRPREIREPVLSIHQGALDLRA